MTDEELAEQIAQIESGRKKFRLSYSESVTGSLNVAPIMLEVLKRVQKERAR